MIVLNALFTLLIAYLFVYCFYQLFFFIKAKDIAKFFEINEKTRNLNFNKNKLCVLIFASAKDKNLDKLLNVLNNQTYSKEFYEVHVIYQRREQDKEIQIDFSKGARIHNIENPDYFSKNKAINLFLQKLIPEEKFDAFVFLGADRMVGEKYLENINKTITKGCVFTGAKVISNNKNQLSKKIKTSIVSSYLKYINSTNNIVRTMLDLPFCADAGNLVIPTDVIEKIGYISFENKNEELEYSLELASNDVKIIYSPYVISAINIKNYDFSSPSIKTKISAFSRYFPVIIMKNLAYREFILFLLKPNSLFVLFGFLILSIICIYVPNFIEQKAVAILGAFLFLNFLISIYTSKMQLKELFWLLFYPFCLLWQKTKIILNNLTMRSIIDDSYDEENINSATISAVANNGKKDFTCKLDLVSEDGMRKTVYRKGNSFIETDLFLRMYDALSDITYRLKTKNITLKICQNCAHFTLCPDGTLDCLKGKCQISQNDILVWCGCQFFAKKSENLEIK